MGLPPIKKDRPSVKTSDDVTGEAPPLRKKIDLFSIAVLNSLSAHVAVIDSGGKIIAINDAWEKFARDNNGDQHAVGVGANYFDACLRASANQDIKAGRKAVSGIRTVLNHRKNEFEMEYTCHSPTQRRWYIMRVTPMQFMGNKAVIAHIDISEKKLAEKRLVEREKELTALHAISRSVNSATSVNGVINAILTQISATIKPDMALVFIKEGQDLLLKGLGPDSTRIKFHESHVHRVGQCLCGLAASTQQPIFSDNILQDKRCTWQECKKAGLTSFAAIPLKNREEVIGTLGIASIVKRDFRQHQEFLEAIANDIAVRLDNTLLFENAKANAKDLEVQLFERKEIEKRLRQTQKMEAIGKLAGGIAHDFNNILSPIIGFTEMSIDELPAESPIHQRLTEVYKAGHRAKDLVQQILTFTRQTEGIRHPIDVSIPVKEATALLRSTLPATIEFAENIQTNLAPIMGDATQFHQIVMNLCTNAAHAMEETGGLLEVRLEQVLLNSKFIVNYKVLSKGNYIKLTISDTGTGIEPHILESIFDPYFTTKSKGQGTGLGLTVVQGITKNHSGEIYVYSEPRKGTTFALYFPVLKEKQELEQRREQAIQGGEESILWVDDEIAIARMGRQMLKNLGYSVTTTTRSEEALRLFRERPHDFDVVVTDMTMPNLRGDQLAERISKIRPDIAIIVCTGFSSLVSKDLLKHPNIRSVLSKPFSQKDIALLIREAIDREMKQ